VAGICLARYGLGAYRQTLSSLMIAHQLSAILLACALLYVLMLFRLRSDYNGGVCLFFWQDPALYFRFLWQNSAIPFE